jgi:hypothetical protein
MARCALCGGVTFKTFELYQQHLLGHHNQEPVKIITPERTTNRTKAQIVHDMEKTWGKAVYPEVKPWHSVGGI